MQEISIQMDKNLINTDLLLLSEPSLPQVMRQLNQCIAFAGVQRGHTVAVCLLDKKDKYYDIVNLVVDVPHRGQGIGREMLSYVLDYVRVRGGRYVEFGAGNASVSMFALCQRMGFRVVGVWPDYFQNAPVDPTLDEGIKNRDMIRYRLDLQEQL